MPKAPQEHGEDGRIAHILGDHYSHQGRLNSRLMEKTLMLGKTEGKRRRGREMYGCESWTIKKAEHQRIDSSEQ